MPDQTIPAEIDRIVEQRVAQRIAQEASKKTLGQILAAGEKAFGGGPDGGFTKACNNLQMLGANEAPDFLATIGDLDNGHAVLHHLGQNEDQALDIFDMTPRRRTIELARLSARLATSSKDSSKAKPEAGPVDLERANMSDFIAARDKEMKARGSDRDGRR